MNKVCGIYKITNLINGKIYVGQSVNIYKRWQAHKATKDDLPIHRAIQKYGKRNFSFEIIEECSIDELDKKEIYYIEKFNSYALLNPSGGYNLTLGGEGGAKKKVCQYDKNGNLLNVFDTMEDAANEVGKTVSQISGCCRKVCVSCGGFLWSYYGETPEEYVAIGERNKVKIDQYLLSGEFIKTYDSMTDAAEELSKTLNKKCSKECISYACNNENSSVYGFLWRKNGENPPPPYKSRYEKSVLQIDLDGNIVNVYHSLKEASDKTGISKSNICYCCKGKRNLANGYIWQYA